MYAGQNQRTVATGWAIAAPSEPGAGGAATRGRAGAAGGGTGTSSARSTSPTLAADGPESDPPTGTVTGDAVGADRLRRGARTVRTVGRRGRECRASGLDRLRD